jgi:hypothetical protein
MLAKDHVARFSDEVIGLVISCTFVKTSCSFVPKISIRKTVRYKNAILIAAYYINNGHYNNLSADSVFSGEQLSAHIFANISV